jgi:hypothetical protein
MGIVVEVINELENFHITKEALEVGAFFLDIYTQRFLMENTLRIFNTVSPCRRVLARV